MHHHGHHRHDGGSHSQGGERSFARGGMPLAVGERHGRHRGAVAKDLGAVPAPAIVRAVENLKTALRLRLAGEPIGGDRVQAIAAAIDAAAAEAERA